MPPSKKISMSVFLPVISADYCFINRYLHMDFSGAGHTAVNTTVKKKSLPSKNVYSTSRR